MFIAGIVAYRTNCLKAWRPAPAEDGWRRGDFRPYRLADIEILCRSLWFFNSYNEVCKHRQRVIGALLASAYYAIWESLLLWPWPWGFWRCSHKLNFSNKLTQKMSAGAFAVYMFQPADNCCVTMLMTTLNILPVFKWALAGLISIPLYFLIATTSCCAFRCWTKYCKYVPAPATLCLRNWSLTISLIFTIIFPIKK